MFALGLGTVWFGYSTMYYGITQIQGGNWSFTDLIFPSRAATLAGIPRDDGTASSGFNPTGAALSFLGKHLGNVILGMGGW